MKVIEFKRPKKKRNIKSKEHYLKIISKMNGEFEKGELKKEYPLKIRRPIWELNLPKMEERLLAYIENMTMKYGSKEKYYYVSNKKAAVIIGCSYGTLKNAKMNLIKKGLIVKVKDVHVDGAIRDVFPLTEELKILLKNVYGATK